MSNPSHASPAPMYDDQDAFQVADLLTVLRPHWIKIGLTTLVVGAVTYGLTLLITPTFTARTTILAPQQPSSAASALASLGGLSGLAGLAGGSKTQADQYVSLMQSVTLSDRILDRFKLVDVYEAKFREDARRELSQRVRINAGKKDNLITIDVDDTSPDRARQIADAYVDELRKLSNVLALTEAQQRRMFFEQQLKSTRDALTSAQLAVQTTGFTQGALKSEPKAAAETYAQIKAQIASAEVRLAALRQTLTDNAPEVQQLGSSLASLRGQLAQYERPMEASSKQDYTSAYREFKYQEALFEIFAKQFEAAKMDEAREGALIQILDPALTPERKSKPQRTLIALGAGVAGFLVSCAYFWIRRRKA